MTAPNAPPARFPILVKTWAGDATRTRIVRRSLASLVASRLPAEARVVIVDDANEPGEFVRFLLELARAHANVSIWRNPSRLGPNKGQAVNFARLVEEFPDSEFYVNCDDDVLYNPDWLAQLIALYREGRAAGLEGIWSAGNFPYRRAFRRVKLPSGLVLFKERQAALNWLIPRDVYLKVGPFVEPPGGMAYDTDYTNRTIALGLPILCMKPSLIQNLGITGAYQRYGLYYSADFVDENPLANFLRRQHFAFQRIVARLCGKYDGPIFFGTG